MKLHFKFCAVLLIMSALIVCMMAGIMEFFIYRNFTDFVAKRELAQLDSVVNVLKEIYAESSGWETLKGNENRWHQMLQKAVFIEDRNKMVRPPPPEPRHPPVSISQIGQHPPGPGDRPHMKPRPDGPEGGLNLPMRLCLFDRDKRPVAGRFNRDERYVFREILINGEAAGLLGLHIFKNQRHPLEMDFLKAQKKAFLLMGTGILLLSVFLSYALARQLLYPIEQLMKGTKAMQYANFDIEIDVTSRDELGMLAEDFNTMARTLKQYEHMRKQWISDISHELRTPLSVLRAKIEAVQDGIRAMTPGMVDSLHEDVTRLGKLVENLHSLSLADSEALTMVKSIIAPLKILKDTLKGFQVKLEHQQIRVKFHVSSDLEPSLKFNKAHPLDSQPQINRASLDSAVENNGLHYISGNRDALTRLFSNLIENSLRYTDPPGFLDILVFTEGQYLKICFEDSPPGVPDNALTQIFNRLYRVDKSRSREFGGSGLGLSICRQIVENHQGSILAGHSDSGGLKITVKLPLINT